MHVIHPRVPQLLHLDLEEEDALEIGLTCAGALRVLVEPLNMAPEIAAPIKCLLDSGTSKLAAEGGFRVHVNGAHRVPGRKVCDRQSVSFNSVLRPSSE
jgi:xanthine/CO dehydrogenase XdhC/CoxF family maturation factor